MLLTKFYGWVLGSTLLLMHCTVVHANSTQDRIWAVKPSSKVKVIMHTDQIVRAILPKTIFGFNIRWTNFQQDLWDASESQVKSSVITAMKPFAGACFRYPGGLVANSFLWEDTIGPDNQRKGISIFKRDITMRPLFGVDEYFNFVNEIKGQPLFVLNLIGQGTPSASHGIHEFPSDKIALSNQKLAEHIKQNDTIPGTVQYYQLGNELDRNTYQWSTGKYIQRSLNTIQAIHKVDPQAKFIAFLRQFNWHYRGGSKTGISRYQDFISDVLQGLPMVNDISFHSYYDGRLRKGTPFQDIPKALQGITRGLRIAKKTKGNAPVNLWITEHARRIETDMSKDIHAQQNTSNILGAISTADFLISISQIPEIKGACWQSLNGIGRQVFDASMHYNDLRPRTIYWALLALKKMSLQSVVFTERFSPNNSNYPGGYDINAVGFINKDHSKIGLWVVNRSKNEVPLTTSISEYKNKKVKIQHYYIAGEGDLSKATENITIKKQLTSPTVKGVFDGEGNIVLTIPPLSISTFILTI